MADNIDIPDTGFRWLDTGEPWQKKAKRGGVAFVGAEAASMVVSAGLFTFLDELSPSLVKNGGKLVGKILLPFLDNIEWSFEHFCNLKECKPDYTKSREERAENYGRFITRFGVSFVPSLLTEIYMRKGIKKLLKVPNGEHKSFLSLGWGDALVASSDKLTQLLGTILVNTKFSNQADQAIPEISNVLQKTTGMSKDTADRAAQSLVIWQGPDILGVLAGLTAETSIHYRNRNK